MKKILNLLALQLILFPASIAQVQEQVAPAERKQQTVVTEPITLYKGFLRVSIASSYNVIDKVFLDSKKQSLEGNIWGQAFSSFLYVTYGITDRLMAEAQMPYVKQAIYQSVVYELPFDFDGQYIYPRTWNTESSGTGDLDLTAGYQLVQETLSSPAAALFLTATLPTGEKDIIDDDDDDPNTYYMPTGQGELAFSPAIRIRQVRYPFAYSVGVSYKMRNEVTKIMAVNEPAVRYKNGNMLDVTGTFHYHLNDWIVFKNIASMFSIQQDTRNGEKTGKAQWSLQYTPGISFQLKRMRFDQAVMIPVKGNNMAADAGYILILQYTF